MKNQTKLFALAGVLLAAGLGFGIASYTNPKSGTVQSAAVSPAPAATSFSYVGVEGTTALDLLVKKANVQMKGSGANAYVIAINGRASDDSKKEYWAFYVNGRLADTGAGSYTTKSGDQIRWQIETY